MHVGIVCFVRNNLPVFLKNVVNGEKTVVKENIDEW